MLAFTLFRPPPTQGPYARDFEAYYAAGATWNAGGDPYSRAVWRVERTIAGVDPGREELLPYVGPPAALPLYGALARLPHPTAERLWSGLLALACGVLVLGGLALTGTRRIAALLAAFVLVTGSGATTSAIALGQAALISAAAFCCALAAFERRAFAAGAVATFAAALHPNLVIALVARLRDRATLLSAAAATAAFAAATLAAGGGVRGFLAYLHRLGEHGAAERFVTIQHTPAAIARSFGAQESAAVGIGNTIAIVAVVATIAAIVRLRLDARDGTLLAIAALPLALPFFHEHDFVLALIPLLVLGVIATGRTRVLAGIAAVMIGVDWLGLAQRNPAEAQIVCLGIAVAGAFVVLGRGARATRADLAPLLTLALLATVAVPLARAHPAPIWPDMLPGSYRAPAAADASAVWAGEQRAAGLDAQHPVWGALRAVPLAGSIVLSLAIVGARRRADRSAARTATGSAGG